MKKKNLSIQEKRRQKAEEQLKRMRVKSKIPASEADMIKLIHELELHQIELKMQNEELVSAIEKTKVAEENLRNTFSLSPSIIAKVNTNTGFFILANEAVTKILGYSIEEFTTTPIKQIIHPDDVKNTRDEVSKQIKGKELVHFENRYLCKNGSYKWLTWQSSEVDNNGIITVIGSDITARKVANELLLKNQHYLEKAQELGNIGTWEINLLTNKLQWTDETYKIFGIPLGTPINFELFINSIHPVDRDYVAKKWVEAFSTHTYDIEHRILANGVMKWVREKAKIEYNSRGNATVAIGCVQDITKR